MISAACFELEPFARVAGPTLAGNRPKTDQNANLEFSFPTYVLVSMSIVQVSARLRPSCGTSAPRPVPTSSAPSARHSEPQHVYQCQYPEVLRIFILRSGPDRAGNHRFWCRNGPFLPKNHLEKEGGFAASFSNMFLGGEAPFRHPTPTTSWPARHGFQNKIRRSFG